MNEWTVLLLALAFLAYAVSTGRLNRTILTAPLLFMVLGLALGDAGLGVLELGFDHELLDRLAEFTLLLVLFTDASRINMHKLRGDAALPGRLLFIGMPMTIALGFGAAMFLPLGLKPFEAALLAAVLAPTDAALGQAVVSSPYVPERLKRALNVESGLNDGIALPLVLLFAALASIGDGHDEQRNWAVFTTLQLVMGPMAGIAVGWLGAKLFDYGSSRGWLRDQTEGAGAIGLALVTFIVAELLGGNGFIAAFVGGLTFGNCLKSDCRFLIEFMEAEGQTLILIMFATFGAALLPEVLDHITWATLAYAALSLTVVRMLPVALSLIGAGVDLKTTLFLGWFGPRGLASILFAVFLFDAMSMGAENTLLAVIFLTVALSVLLHGLTALPGSKIFGVPKDGVPVEAEVG